MRRVATLVALVAIAGVGVALAQRLSQDRQYRKLLADGEGALSRGQSYLAIESFSGALALRPDSMVAYYRRGQAYREQRQDDKAIRDLREAARLSPNVPQPFIALGDLYDQRDDPAQAAEWYGQAADRLKDADPALLYSWALALYRSGSPAAAKAPLKQALARNDSAAEAHYLLGLVYRDAQAPDDAIQSLEQAVRLAPALVPAREELADLYRERGRTNDELKQLDALADLDRHADRRVAIGLAEARRDEFGPALTALDAAAIAEPNNSRVFLAIGRVLLARAERTSDRRSLPRAISALERALGGTARRSEGLALFGRALYLSGDLAGAERILQEAIATSPVDAEAFSFLADAAEHASHYATARDALIDLDALQGGTVSSVVQAANARRIGGLALSANDPRTALTFLTHALDVAPPDAGTLGMLARARWQTGDVAGAKIVLGQALALNAADADLLRLTRTIR